MKLRLVQIDAFADRLFEGNPAAVMPLESWLPDRVLQQLAAENNLAETAFIVSKLPPDATVQDTAAQDAAAPDAPGHDATAHGDTRPAYHLRWFTPAVEVDLCGHATLATASYLLTDVHPDAPGVRFWTRSGWLAVDRAEDDLVMDLPSQLPAPIAIDPVIEAALGVPVAEMLRAADLVCVVPDPETVRSLKPDLRAIGDSTARGVVVTAAGDGDPFDFVSRWFGGFSGAGEDPVTGSAHAQIAPMWAQRLGRTTLLARQLSARGGTVRCRVEGDRTILTGRCIRYLDGTVTVPGGI